MEDASETAAAHDLTIDERVGRLRHLAGHRDRQVRWKAQSRLVGALRVAGEHERLSRELESLLEAERDPDLIAQARLAQAATELELGRPERVLDQLDALSPKSESSWGSRALRLKARAQLASGDARAAMATLDGLIGSLPEGTDRADARMSLAELHAGEDDLEEAMRLLGANLALGSRLDSHWLEASRWMLDQLGRPRGPAFGTANALFAEMQRAFNEKEPEKLAALMDEREFVAGPLGGPAEPRDAEWLTAAVGNSVKHGGRPQLTPRAPRLEGDATTVFVLSYGWLGFPVPTDAWLRLTLDSDGWRWNGLFFTAQPTKRRPRDGNPPRAAATLIPHNREPDIRLAAFHDDDPPAPDCPAPANTPNDGGSVDFTLLAPWAAGNSMLLGEWFLADPTPVVGGECTDLLGWPGQYFLEGNHGNLVAENYAMDILKWGVRIGTCPIPVPPFVAPCPWPWPTPGTPVAAVAAGVVTTVGGAVNAVFIDHLDGSGAPDGYRSAYLHMMPSIVQEGQFVARGQVIGIVGAFGTAEAHLHFHLLRDTGSGFEPVIPSPMEGITLDWCGTRQCIRSSNTDTYSDVDGDQVIDAFDNCPEVANPMVGDGAGGLWQPDADGDGWGDACSCAPGGCPGDQYCDSSARPPACATPACVSDADCPGPSDCVGTGATAQCSSIGDGPLDCSDVNLDCLIGNEPIADCEDLALTAPEPDEEPWCPGGQRHPASAHEAACLSASQELASHLHCISH